MIDFENDPISKIRTALNMKKELLVRRINIKILKKIENLECEGFKRANNKLTSIIIRFQKLRSAINFKSLYEKEISWIKDDKKFYYNFRVISDQYVKDLVSDNTCEAEVVNIIDKNRDSMFDEIFSVVDLTIKNKHNFNLKHNFDMRSSSYTCYLSNPMSNNQVLDHITTHGIFDYEKKKE
jgi:hypothetical protein